MSFTSGARGAGEIGVFLDKRLFADLAIDPSRSGFGEEGRRQDVVTWYPDCRGVVNVCGWSW